MTHPVSIAVASMREHPEQWTVNACHVRHSSGVEVWTANSAYGIGLRGFGVDWGGVTMLSSFGLSFRHWQLWFAAKKLIAANLSKALNAELEQSAGASA